MAYPQTTDDNEELVTGEDELGLDGLDSDLDDFLGAEEEDEKLTMSTDTDESELNISDFDGTLGTAADLESSDVYEVADGELELDLDFDQDKDPDLALNDESISGDDLPEFEDLGEPHA